MSFSENWEQSYSNNQQMSRWPWDDLITIFYRLGFGRVHPRVLELGCGSGANIPFFKSLGLDYSAVDGSKTIIEALQKTYPEYASTLAVADFTRAIPFEGPFDLIFDRAGLTCNSLASVKRAIMSAMELLRSGGTYIGIHWYSSQSSWAQQGRESAGETNTREGFLSGPFKGIEPVHFFSREEIQELFSGHNFIWLEHVERESFIHYSGDHNTKLSMWNFAVQKR